MKLTAILTFTGAALAAPGSIAAVTTTTVTSTVTSGSTSTAYTFVSGNPPSSSSTAAASAADAANKKRDTTSTVTELTTVAGAATTTQTYYPCASPFPSLTPTLPYGDASLPSGFSTENSLFSVESTSEGASAQACCNTCFFELENCIQAYWYSYEGCVVSLATNSSLAGSATGQQVSSVCPAGVFEGLAYANDTDPAFQSTGNIAGPCGTSYQNI